MSKSQDLVVELRGLRFHYRDVGHPDAPAVVMLHGIMGHNREWDCLVERLADAGRRIIVLDQRGHGCSDWAIEYSPGAMAEDLKMLVDLLGLDHPSVIGHSMGGMAAMVALARWPESFDRLVLVDVGPDSVSDAAAAEISQWMHGLGMTSYASVEDAYAEWSGDPLADPELLRNYVVHNLATGDDGRLRWRFDAAGLLRFFVAVNAAELWTAVDRISAPVLLVRGAHSPFLSEGAAQALVRRLRSARLAVVAGGGHDLGVQQPRAVADAALVFLGQPVSPAAAV